MAEAITKTSRGYSKFPFRYPFYDKEMNANFDLINADINNIEAGSLTAGQKTLLTGGGYTTLHQHAGILEVHAMWTLNQPFAFWGSVEPVGTSNITQIIIKPKVSPFGKFIGAILNDGEYLETNTAITVSITDDQLNGISALANSIYILRPYKDISGNLAFGFDWMPITTFSEANPTNTLTLAQVDGKDIGLCFPADSELVVFDASAKFQTPCFYSGGAYDSAGELYTASRTGSVLTLNKNLNISSLAGGKIVYVVSGFKPIDYSTGNITSLIGTRGYSDAGIRIITNASANIIPFIISGNKFYFVNGTGAANSGATNGYGTFGLTTSFVNYRNSFFPVDKNPVMHVYGNGCSMFNKLYYAAYGEGIIGIAGTQWGSITDNIKALHGIMSLAIDINNGSVAIYGYEI